VPFTMVECVANTAPKSSYAVSKAAQTSSYREDYASATAQRSCRTCANFPDVRDTPKTEDGAAPTERGSLSAKNALLRDVTAFPSVTDCAIDMARREECVVLRDVRMMPKGEGCVSDTKQRPLKLARNAGEGRRSLSGKNRSRKDNNLCPKNAEAAPPR